MTRHGGGNGGTIVVLDGEVARGLRQVASRWSMTILEAEVADQAFQLVRAAGARVIIVQVGLLMKEELAFIRLMKSGGRQVHVIAAAIQHSIELERKVRRAGATYYVPGVERDLLDPLLKAILVQEKQR